MTQFYRSKSNNKIIFVCWWNLCTVPRHQFISSEKNSRFLDSYLPLKFRRRFIVFLKKYYMLWVRKTTSFIKWTNCKATNFLKNMKLQHLHLLPLNKAQFSWDKLPQDPSIGNTFMHFCVKTPIYIWRPIKAKTDNENIVKIITSLRFFTDSITAPTMVFKPVTQNKTLSNYRNLKNYLFIYSIQVMTNYRNIYEKVIRY